MYPPNLEHLSNSDPNAVPVLPVPRPIYEDDTEVLPGGGMRVARTGFPASARAARTAAVFLVSTQPSEEISDDGGGSTLFVDPLATVSFRARITPSGVTIATSYINDIYYNKGWIHEHFEIESETLPISVFPQFLYLKLPVRYVSANSIISLGKYPVSDFTSDEFDINGSGFTYTDSQSTAYVTRNREAEEPDNYFILSEVAITDNTLVDPGDGTDAIGFWHFLIATVNNAGSISQINLGSKTLPQAFHFRLVSMQILAT